MKDSGSIVPQVTLGYIFYQKIEKKQEDIEQNIEEIPIGNTQELPPIAQDDNVVEDLNIMEDAYFFING